MRFQFPLVLFGSKLQPLISLEALIPLRQCNWAEYFAKRPPILSQPVLAIHERFVVGHSQVTCQRNTVIIIA
jgi:hypothetical protein